MNRLKKLRTEAGYTQEEISKYLKTKQNIYSRYERGATQLNIKLVKQLSQIYNVSADYILELTDEKRPLK